MLGIAEDYSISRGFFCFAVLRIPTPISIPIPVPINV